MNGGNPILSTNSANETNILFNDMQGTTLGVFGNGKANSIKRDAFGQTFANSVDNIYNIFTGQIELAKLTKKPVTEREAQPNGNPKVEGLGYAFLFRNYRANLGKWQTADPLGYPDGWNNLTYVNNRVTNCFDWLGGITYEWTNDEEKVQRATYVEAPILWNTDPDWDIYDIKTYDTYKVWYMSRTVDYYKKYRWVDQEWYYKQEDVTVRKTENGWISGAGIFTTAVAALIAAGPPGWIVITGSVIVSGTVAIATSQDPEKSWRYVGEGYTEKILRYSEIEYKTQVLE